MLGRPDLSFKSQREALSQAASAAPTGDIYGQAMQSAQNLLNNVQNIGNMARTVDNSGISKEALLALWNGRNSDVQGEINAIDNKLNELNTNSPANMGDRAKYLTDLAIKKGFDPQTAQALVLNMQDESGLKNDIVEGAPNVHGTRGQGLYQLTDTKPGVGRRSDYLNFMKNNGRNDLWSDDSQMEFAWWERNNTEKANWDRVMGMNGVGNRASGIVEHVLRPAREHRINRQNRYLALGY